MLIEGTVISSYLVCCQNMMLHNSLANRGLVTWEYAVCKANRMNAASLGVATFLPMIF
jgi:hypothetical protein